MPRHLFKSITFQQKQEQKDISSGTLRRNERQKNGIMVLCYHRVIKDDLGNNIIKMFTNNSQIHEYSVNVSTFKTQLNYLKKHHVRFISIQEMISLLKRHKSFKHQYVVMTFDDFDKTVYDNGAPILNAYKIPYTIFVVTGITGEYNGGTKLASWAQIREMSRSKLVTVGVHTDHLHYLVHNKSAVVAPGGYNDFKQDYRRSQRKVSHYLGKQTEFFAYPYGTENEKVQNYLVSHGVVSFSLNIGLIDQKTSLTNSLPRTMIDQNTWRNVVVAWVR